MVKTTVSLVSIFRTFGSVKPTSYTVVHQMGCFEDFAPLCRATLQLLVQATYVLMDAMKRWEATECVILSAKMMPAATILLTAQPAPINASNSLTTAPAIRSAILLTPAQTRIPIAYAQTNAPLWKAMEIVTTHEMLKDVNMMAVIELINVRSRVPLWEIMVIVTTSVRPLYVRMMETRVAPVQLRAKAIRWRLIIGAIENALPIIEIQTMWSANNVKPMDVSSAR